MYNTQESRAKNLIDIYCYLQFDLVIKVFSIKFKGLFTIEVTYFIANACDYIR